MGKEGAHKGVEPVLEKVEPLGIVVEGMASHTSGNSVGGIVEGVENDPGHCASNILPEIVEGVPPVEIVEIIREGRHRNSPMIIGNYNSLMILNSIQNTINPSESKSSRQNKTFFTRLT